MMHSATSHFKEKYGEKYLIIDSAEKYKKVSSGIKPEIKTLNDGKGLFYEKNYAKLGINTDGHLPLKKKKKLKFPKLTIIIRCVLQYEKLYPQIYLNKCLYEFHV